MFLMRTSPSTGVVWTSKSLRVWQQACCRLWPLSWNPCGHTFLSLEAATRPGWPPRMSKSRTKLRSRLTPVYKIWSGIICTTPPLFLFSPKCFCHVMTFLPALLHPSFIPFQPVANPWFPQQCAICRTSQQNVRSLGNDPTGVLLEWE